MKINDAPTSWIPTYKVRMGDREEMIEIESMAVKECPVCIITPEAQAMVTEVMNMEAVRERTGATLYGTDTAKWPTKWYDTVRLVQNEEWRVDNAIEKRRQEVSR